MVETDFKSTYRFSGIVFRTLECSLPLHRKETLGAGSLRTTLPKLQNDMQAPTGRVVDSRWLCPRRARYHPKKNLDTCSLRRKDPAEPCACLWKSIGEEWHARAGVRKVALWGATGGAAPSVLSHGDHLEPHGLFI